MCTVTSTGFMHGAEMIFLSKRASFFGGVKDQAVKLAI